MSGEQNLSVLLRSLRPVRQPGEYVYCLRPLGEGPLPIAPIGTFAEAEGLTVIVPRTTADELGWPYTFVAAWITLTVHSSLEAVGLTAAVAQALTEANISCNVVAAYFHDHIFVPLADAERVLETLLALAESERIAL